MSICSQKETKIKFDIEIPSPCAKKKPHGKLQNTLVTVSNMIQCTPVKAAQMQNVVEVKKLW